MSYYIKGCYVTLLLVCIAPNLLAYLNEPDVWFHMACGKEMLATGQVDVSKFYYTEINTSIRDFKFTWLGDIILYLIHFIGGPVGLQVLRVEVTVLIVYCLWVVSDKKVNSYKCLITILVVYGLSQALVVRNSIFGTLFLCTLWYLHLNSIKYKHVWSIVLLIVWSQMHGSFLLGIVMYVALSVCSVKSLIAAVLASIALNYITPISIFDFISVPTSFNLNDTIFHPNGSISQEYCSPFYLPKHYTVFMLLLSGLYVLLIKRVRLIYIVPFVLTLVPALGYIRMVGPHVITCGMCLMYAERMADLRCSIRPWVFTVLAVLAGYDGWVNNYVRIGLGVSPNFESVKGQQATRNVFTQDYLTSYMYFNYGVKGFFSTFHAPHTAAVRRAYTHYIQNPDAIDSSINTCIMKDRVYANGFFNSKKWVGSKQGHVYIFNRRGVM